MLLSNPQFLWSRETSWLTFWKRPNSLEILVGVDDFSIRIFAGDHFTTFRLFMREGLGMSDGGEKSNSLCRAIWMNSVNEKQMTQGPTYIVWEEVSINILFSTSTPCYLTFCSPWVIMFCGVSLFSTLFLCIPYIPDTPRSKYSLVSC